MALGCEKHTASIWDRGARKRIDLVPDVTSIEWERVRDDISTARVTVGMRGPDCRPILDRFVPARHELVIHRGDQRVWEGPLTYKRGQGTDVVLEARDVMHYVYRTIAKKAYNNSGIKVTTCIQRALNMLNGEVNRKENLSPPANVLPYVQALFAPGDAKTSRSTKPYQTTVFEQIDDMAAKSGLDYTTVGRSIVLFDTHTVLGVTPQMTEADFMGDIIVTVYGMEIATFAAVTDGQDIWGANGGDDPYYGNWEVLHTAYSEQEEGAEPPTKEELRGQAERNRDGRETPPLEVRIPDGTRLNPKGAWDINKLVPGVRIPVVATLPAMQVGQMQKLDKVKVVDAAGMESVMVTLSPASKNDTPPIEDGEPGSEV